MAKGLVKDVARRLQTLRKERGYNPTDVLGVASILDLDKESLEILENMGVDYVQGYYIGKPSPELNSDYN